MTTTSTPSSLPGDPAAVTDAWARIDAWLRLHSPASYKLLAGPADPAEIEAAEAAMGLCFPQELLASLACHDGLAHWTVLLPLKPPLSVAQIVESWQMYMDIQGDLEDQPEPGSLDPVWWHPLWVPFGELDSDAQVIDLREGPGQGALSMTYHDDIGLVPPSWPSLAAYLQEVADVLERGGAVDEEWAPFLRENGELWWDVPLPEGEASTLTPAPTTHHA